MAKNLLAPRKHYISAYKNDVCIFHRGYDSFARALQAFAEQREAGEAESIIFWKGTRKKPFAEFNVSRETVETVSC